jgi:hypothetical protein
LGRNSLIEEEESVFLALCGWIQDAEAKLRSLSQAAASQKDNASAAATPGSVKSKDDSDVLKLATVPDAKVHDEEVSDIDDDEELSGSDVELKFSDEDEDDESDSDDGAGEKSYPLMSNKQTGLALDLNKIKDEGNNAPGVSLRRTPPMLGSHSQP